MCSQGEPRAKPLPEDEEQTTTHPEITFNNIETIKKAFNGVIKTIAYNEDIKAAIKAQYEDDSYDVMEKLDERLNGGNSSNGTTSFAVVFWNAAIVLVAATVVVVINNKNTQKVLDAVNKKETKKKEK